jgi:RimJ/RimL family protein N-acetyltransferase
MPQAYGAATVAGVNDRRAPPQLRTERLLLRQWRADDREPFAAMNADPEVMRHVGSGTLDDAGSDALRATLAREWEHAGHGLWALERISDGRLLGFCGLAVAPFALARRTGADAAGPAVEIGWRLRRDAWGHGYATEAALAALTVAWEALARRQVVCLIHPDNDRSLAVAERLGMRVTGRTTHGPTGWRVLVLRLDRPPPA